MDLVAILAWPMHVDPEGSALSQTAITYIYAKTLLLVKERFRVGDHAITAHLLFPFHWRGGLDRTIILGPCVQRQLEMDIGDN